ncbi:hypothetical protein KTGMC3_P1197 [Methanocalculus sp. MC3]
MKTKTKDEKKSVIRRFRKRISLTIDPENYDFIQDTGLNVSKVLDVAIHSLRLNMYYETLVTALIANSELKKNTKNKASGGNRTRDLFLTKEARYRYATEAIVVPDNKLPV